MLPILRIVPVGGVLLAILILVLALSPPGGMNSTFTPLALSARGPLLQKGDHPEWRQFLIQAALRRADELRRLSELPDDDIGSIGETITATTIPIEIGEPSSTELPLSTLASRPAAVVVAPQSVKVPFDIKKKRVHRRGKSLAVTAPAPQQDIFTPLIPMDKKQKSGPQPKVAPVGSAQASGPETDRATIY